MRPSRFRLLVLCGALPILLLGMGASALANKIVFAFWAVMLATAWALILRWGIEARWGAWIVAGRLLFLLAAGAALWARLVTRHGEELDLGMAAFLPAIQASGFAQPRNAYGAAIGIAIAGTLAIIVGHGVGRLGRGARA